MGTVGGVKWEFGGKMEVGNRNERSTAVDRKLLTKTQTSGKRG